ncbi:2-oxoglutarate dehydrogenase complex dihydrolipoyllysine-residue succinyltransferase [Desulfuromonas sp. AOP6]|uniref:2-oxoglutarate dehydrogenase complex dihydrolipoyllysine-residue succinyltransferase n=1 Tax=Desulfuromonas sp. AOP6 TaxID=1566351 RepID=UPI00127FE9E0|nr:2-oxoglutarate dehydrogenase complex dihydrolipoyllysine-residue succinyltransferase [Desulfuromonas sp. AOP6]BCA78619.1 dihydrolipoyllysine-residue succinyltransferasecomponent of 2-oxoglutarate dehydrogenase complex [Desulfuromonas sp. AOP6]
MKITVPEIGESVFEAVVGKWHKKDGDFVRKDEVLLELETDKINLEIQAEADGSLAIGAQEGETVKVGGALGNIDEKASSPPKTDQETSADDEEKKEEKPKAAEDKPPAVNPAAAKMARERGIDLDTVSGSGRNGRITVDDVLQASNENKKEQAPSPPKKEPAAAPRKEPAAEPEESGRTTRKRMSPLRKKIAERLVAVRQQTAMLTTFNEADMSRIDALRQKHKEAFREKHGVSLGLMSFFVKACVEALKAFPEVNARIDGEDMVFQHFYDIGIAVGSERGLIVPVLRHADGLSFAGIEQGIQELVDRIQNNRITLDELEGGTFTISNGGIYGSMLSTPILNPPQSGVLGMHAIEERAVVCDGKVVIRPIMYLALSYDHRIIDGKQAVQFLRKIKEVLEEPEELLFEL